MKKSKIVCDISFVPFLQKLACVNGNRTDIETSNPEECQKAVDKLLPGYKLLFGKSYDSILIQGKYFTV